MTKLVRILSLALLALLMKPMSAQLAAPASASPASDVTVNFEVLSDTGASNLAPYMKNVAGELKKRWAEHVTVSDLQPLQKQEETVLDLTISSDGQISSLKLTNSSDDAALDKAAWAAATASAYSRLPTGLKDGNLKLRVHFVVSR